MALRLGELLYSSVFDYIRKQLPGITLRPVQEAIFSQLEKEFYFSPLRAAVIAAPTGSGKSLIAEVSANYISAVRTGNFYAWYVVPTVHLQTQYFGDFSRFPFRSYMVLAGRNLYPCPYLTEKYGQKMSGQPYTANDCVLITSGGTCPYAPITNRKIVYSSNLSDFIATLNDSQIPYAFYSTRSGWALQYFPEKNKYCPYFLYRILSPRYRNIITNYDVFFIEWAKNFGLAIPHLLIFDEAHVIFEKILSRFSPRISLNNIARKLDLDLDEYLTRFHSLASTGTTSVAVTAAISVAAQMYMDAVHRGRLPRDVVSRYMLRVQNYNDLAQIVTKYWDAFSASRVKSNGYVRIVVDPVLFLGDVIREFLTTPRVLPNGHPYHSLPEDRKVLIMSGTVGDRKLWSLVFRRAGLTFRDWSYYDFSHVSYPPDLRPVYYVPFAPITRETFIDYVDEITDIISASYLDQDRLAKDGYYVRPAVVVHAYLRSAAELLADTLASRLEEYGRDSGEVRLAMADPDYPIREVIDEFRKNGGILVSTTGAAEGVDFRDDLARLQFIVKAPVPGSDYPRSLRDFYVAKTIVQMAGRVARSADDFGATFIIDSRAFDHYSANTELYPQYYRDAVRIFPKMSDAYDDYLKLFRQYVPMRSEVK